MLYAVLLRIGCAFAWCAKYWHYQTARNPHSPAMARLVGMKVEEPTARRAAPYGGPPGSASVTVQLHFPAGLRWVRYVQHVPSKSGCPT